MISGEVIMSVKEGMKISPMNNGEVTLTIKERHENLADDQWPLFIPPLAV